jgi:tRNA 2-thiocytidine biosynthesis protein TtcA
MKKLIQELEKDIPHIGASIMTSLSNINPSQLLDQKLWDFKKITIEKPSEQPDAVP